MTAIVLIDTSVYLNILDVPGYNQNRGTVFDEFKDKIQAGDSFLLPLATILETGNHIAHLTDGEARWKYATILVDDVRKALNGDAPYRPTVFPTRDDFFLWLKNFPDYAKRTKKVRKEKEEGVSLSDFSLVKEWERTCDKNSMSHVMIWSLDSDLSGYDRIL